jgi:SAM-dependent methyltransferase
MPSIEWNKQHWGQHYRWSAHGDEWSYSFGSPAAHWYAFILPRLHWFLPDRAAPATRIVEIAPGHGRWTQFLLDHCKTLAAYDVSEACVAYCGNRFEDRVADGSAEFHVTDGMSLPEKDDSVDLVFSFDSLVHVERDVMQGYLAHLGRCLKPGRYAFLQHSNLAAYPDLHNYKNGGPYILRGTTVSAATMQEDAKARGLITLIQEGLNHETQNMNNELVDCISVLQKPAPGRAATEAVFLSNRYYPAIGKVSKDFALPYERVAQQA